MKPQAVDDTGDGDEGRKGVLSGGSGSWLGAVGEWIDYHYHTDGKTEKLSGDNWKFERPGFGGWT